MKLGFIGCGNMAAAMLRGILSKNHIDKSDIIISEISQAAIDKVQSQMQVAATTDNKEAVRKSDVIILSVKPQYYKEVIKDIKDELQDEQLIVTIAPGKTLEWVEAKIGKPTKIIRTMPNTPALVQEGMTGVCSNERVTQEELQQVCNLFKCFGRVELIPENLMDVVTAVSASSPAYVFMFIEAMADAAVADGMPRAQAYQFAAQAVMGSAKMVLETGMHPGELKDMVCSPGGTTIEAVRVLEKKGMRSAVIEAMKSCVGKSRSL